jgi:uncharacterized protein
VGQVGAFVLSTIVGLFFYDRETRQLKTTPGATAAMFVPLWVAFGMTAYIVAKRRGEFAFGRRPYVRRSDGLWFLAGIGAQFAIGAVYLLLPIDTEKLGEPAKEIFDRANQNPTGIVLLGLAVGIGAPIMEELFYRGVIFRGFVLAFDRRSERVRRFAPMVLSSIVFAAIHFQVLQFGALFAVGMLCAFAYRKTDRIASAIAVHAGFNLTTVITLTISVFNNT